MQNQLQSVNNQLSEANDKLKAQEDIISSQISDIYTLQQQIGQLRNDTMKLRKTNRQKDVQLVAVQKDNSKLREENKRLNDIIYARPSFEIDFRWNFKIKPGKNKDIPFVIHKNDNVIKIGEIKSYTIFVAIADAKTPKKPTPRQPGESGIYIIPNARIQINGEEWHDRNGNYWIYNSKCNFEWDGTEYKGKISITSDAKEVIEKSDFRYDYFIFENDKYITGFKDCSMADRFGIEIKGSN